MAIIEELRDALNQRTDSYRTIASAIDIDHAILVRFANKDEERTISLETADKLAAYFGLCLRKPARKRTV